MIIFCVIQTTIFHINYLRKFKFDDKRWLVHFLVNTKRPPKPAAINTNSYSSVDVNRFLSIFYMLLCITLLHSRTCGCGRTLSTVGFTLVIKLPYRLDCRLFTFHYTVNNRYKCQNMIKNSKYTRFTTKLN